MIEERIEPDRIVFTDTLRSCNALKMSDFHHARIHHSERFADQKITWMELKISATKPSVTGGTFHGGKHRALLKQLKS